jgi:hypothetical protein
MGAQRRLVGREAEQQRLVATVEGAARGMPSATLVHGEPGIGKTCLVRDLIEHARAEGVHTLFGQCLRFGADVTSYVPFIQAISQWLQSAARADRDRVFLGVTTVAEVVPALGSRDQESGIVLFQLSAALDRLADDAPLSLSSTTCSGPTRARSTCLPRDRRFYAGSAHCGRRHLPRHRPVRGSPAARLARRHGPYAVR